MQAPEPEKPAPLREERDAGPIDPLALTLATPRLAAPTQPPTATETAPPPTLALDQIAEQLVKKLAWGGNARKGAARIELGAGVWSGATITVVTDEHGVSLELESVGDAEGEGLGQRLRQRLEAKGLQVQDVIVR